MKYKYKNLKHVVICGIPPYGTKVFDHEIVGGGIELVEKIEESEERKIKKIKNVRGE